MIQAYVDGELADAERLILEQHLVECRACARTLDRQRAASAALFEALHDYQLRLDLVPAIMAHLPEMDTQQLAAREANMRAKYPYQRSGWRPMYAVLPLAAASVLLFLAGALFYAWPNWTQGDLMAPIGLVVQRSGEALRSSDESTHRGQVALESVVRPGERYETFDDSRLMLSVAGPSRLKLDQNTRVKLENERLVNLEAGRIWFNVASEQRYFRVRTPSGDVTVFGTVFSVEVRDNAAMVIVQSGEVQVENGSAFTVLRRNEGVQVALDMERLSPKSVNAELLMAWADEISPDSEAQRAFARLVPAPATAVLQAEQVFVVDTRGHRIETIQFDWERNRPGGAFAGYHVYVSDDRMQPLFKEYIPAGVFADAGRSQFRVRVPDTDALEDVNVLHIKVTPDFSSGRVETSFRRVTALGGAAR